MKRKIKLPCPFHLHASFKLLSVAVMAATFVFCQNSYAQFFNNSSGLASPAETITFDEHTFSSATPLTTQYSDYGVSFQHMYYDPVPSESYPNISSPDAGNFIFNQPNEQPFSISFNQVQTSAAFSLASQPGTTTFTALLDGVVVATGSASTSLTNSTDFYGFSGIAFNQISVSVSSPDNAGLIDNIQLAVVPEPTTASSLLAGAAFLGASFCFKRRRARNS